MGDVYTLTADPRFKQLNPQQQRRAVEAMEPKAQGLSDQQFQTFLSSISGPSEPTIPGMEQLGAPPAAPRAPLPFKLQRPPNAQFPEWNTGNTFPGTLAKVVASPVTSISSVAPAITDFIKRGGRTPGPSGGFLTEEPVTQAYGNMVMSGLTGYGAEPKPRAPDFRTEITGVAPTGVRKAARAGAGFVKGGVKAIKQNKATGSGLTGYVVGNVLSGLTGIPHLGELGAAALAAPEILGGATEGARAAVRPVVPPSPYLNKAAAAAQDARALDRYANPVGNPWEPPGYGPVPSTTNWPAEWEPNAPPRQGRVAPMEYEVPPVAAPKRVAGAPKPKAPPKPPKPTKTQIASDLEAAQAGYRPGRGPGLPPEPGLPTLPEPPIPQGVGAGAMEYGGEPVADVPVAKPKPLTKAEKEAGMQAAYPPPQASALFNPPVAPYEPTAAEAGRGVGAGSMPMEYEGAPVPRPIPTRGEAAPAEVPASKPVITDQQAEAVIAARRAAEQAAAPQTPGGSLGPAPPIRPTEPLPAQLTPPPTEAAAPPPVTQGGVLIPETELEGLTPAYRKMAERNLEGAKFAFIKDTKIAQHLMDNGVTPEAWRAATEAEKNAYVKAAQPGVRVKALGSGKGSRSLDTMTDHIEQRLRDLYEANPMRNPPEGIVPEAAPALGAPASDPMNIAANTHYGADFANLTERAQNNLRDFEKQHGAPPTLEDAQAGRFIKGRAGLAGPPEIPIPSEAEAGASSIETKLQESIDAANKRMAERHGKTLNAIFPGDDVADMAIWGAAKLAKGTVNFAKWSKEMLADAGPAAETLKPQLAKVYAKAQKTLERHITNTAGDLPRTQKLLSLYRKGIAGQDWYMNTRAEMEKVFGARDAPMFVNFLAATSPNTTVASNVTLALKAYGQWKSGQPFTGYLPETINSLNKAINGNEFGGLKVRSFTKNLMGDPLPVTIDRWMARAFGYKSESITDPQYKMMDYAVTQIAKERGIEPRQFQAAIWKTIKEAEGLAGNTSDSFEAVLHRKIAADPKLAAAIAKALRESGDVAPKKK